MSLPLLVSYLGYGLVFVVMISVLVAAHEYGHYLFARLFNMGVEEFAIGFGKRPILTWMRRTYIVPIRPGEDPDVQNPPTRTPEVAVGAITSAFEGASPNRRIQRIDTPGGPALQETTDFTVRPWPLGGFVRIKGMLPDEDGSEVRIPGGFYSKPPWQRFLVLLAGPLFSVIAGVLVLIPVGMALGDVKRINVPELGIVIPGSPAEQAGLKKGDVVLAVDGQQVPNFYSMVTLVRHSGGKPLRFDLQRKDRKFSATLKAVPDPQETYEMGPDLDLALEKPKSIGYKIGIAPPTVTVPLSFGAAAIRAIELPYIAVTKVFETFTKPKEFSDNVGGPVTMVQDTARAVQDGFWQVLELAGLLSISVGVFNLLPAHPLDGGQMMMALAEMFRGGRRLSIRAQMIAGGLGLTLVAALVLSVFVVDIQRLTAAKADVPQQPNAAVRK